MDYGVFLLDLVMVKRCGSLDYKGQRLVLWSGELLQKKVKCFVKFLMIRNFWTYFLDEDVKWLGKNVLPQIFKYSF